MQLSGPNPHPIVPMVQVRIQAQHFVNVNVTPQGVVSPYYEITFPNTKFYSLFLWVSV